MYQRAVSRSKHLEPPDDLRTERALNPDISRDGRYVVFESIAGNLTDVEFVRGIPRVFLRDRQTGVIRLLSTNASGEPANGPSMNPAISADGDTVVFTSSATTCSRTRGIPGGSIGVYLIRLASNERIASRRDEPGDSVHAGQSAFPAISGDGRYVAFMSKADLTCRDGSCRADDAPDGNGVFDIYVRDTVMQHTRRVSRGHVETRLRRSELSPGHQRRRTFCRVRRPRRPI